MSRTEDTLRAAGTVVTRAGADGPELLLVHRPRYGDWSLPKGKLRPDETFPVAAVRETQEETGQRVRLGAPAGTLGYEVDGQPKVVQFWHATPLGVQGRRTGHEVDASEWFGLDAAVAALTHDTERAVARAAARLVPTVPLVVARHAKAEPRRNWPASDPDRPLAKRGNDQALRLAGLLSAWAPSRIISSPSRRCVDSMQPYAARNATTLELEPLLTEEQYGEQPEALRAFLDGVHAELRRQPRHAEHVAGGSPGAEVSTGTVLCTHRPLLATIGDHFGIRLAPEDRPDPLPPGGCWVLHMPVHGRPTVERHAV